MTGNVAGNVPGIILLFLGGFFVFRGAPGLAQWLRSRSWRRVSGTMLGSGVAGYTTQATAGHMGAQMQRAVFAYGYQVGGQTYRGHRATFGTPLGFGMGLGSIASQQVARYAPGARVDVWVNPTNPADSVLRRSAPSSTVFVILGAALLAVGAVLFLM